MFIDPTSCLIDRCHGQVAIVADIALQQPRLRWGNVRAIDRGMGAPTGILPRKPHSAYFRSPRDENREEREKQAGDRPNDYEWELSLLWSKVACVGEDDQAD